MQDRHFVGRVGLSVVMTTAILVWGSIGGGAALQPSLSASATTTVGDQRVSAIAHQAGQTAELHFDYAEFGDGPHDAVVRLRSTGVEPFLKQQTIVLEGDTGTETVRLDELFDLTDVQVPVGTTLQISVIARGVGPNGDQILNDSMVIQTVRATVYLHEVPSNVRPDDPVSVGYYGWGEPLLEGIDLVADRPPTGFEEQAEDTRIGREFPEQTDTPFVDGTFEFVPEEVLDEVGTSIQLQARPIEIAEDVPGSNVETLTINRPPNAVIGYSPDDPETDQRVRFDGTDSTDPDGEIVEYRWDLSGDNDFESAGEFPTWRYDRSGSVTVTLRVEDDDGATDTDRVSIFVVRGPTDTPTFPPPPFDQAWPYIVGGITVLIGIGFLYRRPIAKALKEILNGEDDGNGNGDKHPPTAVAKAIPSNPSVNRPVLFEGSLSFDPDPADRITTYRWSMDDQEYATPRFVHVFGSAGEYEATLEVTDTHGAMGEATESVTVEEAEGTLILDGVRPDSPGDDHENLDEEYLIFRNDGDAPLDLSGSTLHDAAQEEGRVRPDDHTFAFPDGTELEPGATVTVHTGSDERDGQVWEDTAESRHLFWGNRRAVWNNEGDLVVVEDGDGNPALAARYTRNDAGGYDIAPIDNQQLLDWFPSTELSGSIDTPDGGLGFSLGLESLGGIRTFVAGAFFLRGPWALIKAWAIATVIVLGSGTVGIASESVELTAPLLLLPVTLLMVVIGVIWFVGRWVVGAVRS